MGIYEIVAAFAVLYIYVAVIVYVKASHHENAMGIAVLWLPLGFIIFGFVLGSALLSAWSVFWGGLHDL